MLVVLRSLSALALSLWLGAMFFFSAGVAPVAFRTMPSRELAGNMVNGSMYFLQNLAWVAGGVLLASLLGRAFFDLAQRRATLMKAALAAVLLGLSLYANFGVAQPLAEIRGRIGSIDKLPPDSPERERFERLHKLSVTLMGATMLGATVLLVWEQVPGKTRLALPSA